MAAVPDQQWYANNQVGPNLQLLILQAIERFLRLARPSAYGLVWSAAVAALRVQSPAKATIIKRLNMRRFS